MERPGGMTEPPLDGVVSHLQEMGRKERFAHGFWHIGLRSEFISSTTRTLLHKSYLQQLIEAVFRDCLLIEDLSHAPRTMEARYLRGIYNKR